VVRKEAAKPVDELGLVGSVVDQVRVEECISQGGFSGVYRGVHIGLDEVVAFKCLRVEARALEVRQHLANRFRDEIKIHFKLSLGHLDVVRVLGGGTFHSPRTGELTPYLLMEWLDGHTLSEDFALRRGQPGLPLVEVISLLEGAASALAYAHGKGVVHRDVKPANIFRMQKGGTKVLDFGLAKALSEGLGVKNGVQTSAGTYICTAAYAAPEQLMPSSGPVGPWTDVYSFALVILELLSGQRVRRVSRIAEALPLVNDPRFISPRASDLGLQLHPNVEQILLRAVARKTDERPKNVGDFWRALKRSAVKDLMLDPPPSSMTVVDPPSSHPEVESAPPQPAPRNTIRIPPPDDIRRR
jgi:serine/threonine-protein kinase